MPGHRKSRIAHDRLGEMGLLSIASDYSASPKAGGPLCTHQNKDLELPITKQVLEPEH